MAADVEAKVRGLPDLRLALLSIAPKLRARALLSALRSAAVPVRNAARAATPVLKVETPYRAKGTVRKAISIRTSKIARRVGDVGVFVNVRPAKKGARGARSRTDPFYWRWLNFGWNPASRRTGGMGMRGNRRRRKLNKATSTKIRSGFRFLEAGAKQLGRALEIFKRKIGPQIERLNGGKGVTL